eukprot:COSAG06_NODE_5138_length_3687_cov_4.373467_6_plen_45_part_00
MASQKRCVCLPPPPPLVVVGDALNISSMRKVTERTEKRQTTPFF